MMCVGSTVDEFMRSERYEELIRKGEGKGW